MKKIIIGLFIVSLVMVYSKKEEDIVIPDNAIRFRVVANSNSLKDQQEKSIIKEQVEKELYNFISNSESVSETRDLIKNNMDEINQIVKSYNVPYQIKYGNNYFPTKNYKGVLYPAGNYESLVVTLGEGLGDNFWCVLYPPLCLLDNNSEDVGEVEYQFYVKKLIDRF